LLSHSEVGLAIDPLMPVPTKNHAVSASANVS
jgi:hypothetical protein